MKEIFTTSQVAKAIGVSEASLKRWCDKGLIACTRTGGGHRRLLLSGVLQYLRESGHPLLKPELVGLPGEIGVGEFGLIQSRQPMFEALERGDAEAFRRIGFSLYLGGRSIAEICDETIAEVLRQMGHRWEEGRLDAYRERRACDICLRWLHEVSRVLPPPPDGASLAIGCTTEGDHYMLPTVMVELTLRELGWRAESLGVGLPVDSMLSAIRDLRPQLFWLSISHFDEEATLLTQCRRLRDEAAELGVTAVVGGRMMIADNGLCSRLPFASCCTKLQQLVEFINTLPGAQSEPQPQSQPELQPQIQPESQTQTQPQS